MLLAMYTLPQVEGEAHAIAHSFAPSAADAIIAHDWPGNVRELIACIRRVVVFATGPTIEAADLGIVSSALRPIEGHASVAGHAPGGSATAPEGDRVREVLLRHGYNIRRAAKA